MPDQPWTTDPPTVSGWYWMSDDLGNYMQIVWVDIDRQKVAFVDRSTVRDLYEYKDWSWCGPIEPPGREETQ